MLHYPNKFTDPFYATNGFCDRLNPEIFSVSRTNLFSQLEERREQNPDLTLSKIVSSGGGEGKEAGGGGSGGYLGLGSSPKIGTTSSDRKFSLPANSSNSEDVEDALSEMTAAMQGHQAR